MSDVLGLLSSANPDVVLDGRRGPNNIMIRCPFHASGQERTPSLSVHLEQPVWFCLRGSTRVLTLSGEREIKELAGGEHRVLTSTGQWVPALIKGFGKQRLWRIELQRNRTKKVLYATAEHRWFLEDSNYLTKERTTAHLKKGMALRACFPQSLVTRTTAKRPLLPSPFGIAHGIVFGDGAVANQKENTHSGSQALLYGKKDAQLRKWFPLNPCYVQPKRTIIHGLPKYFKDRPSLQESAAYLYGWLAGYFAADGTVSSRGDAVLHSSKRDDLEFVRTLCLRIGVGTYEVTKGYMRKGYGKKKSAIYALSFLRSTLPPAFFLIQKHQERFTKNPPKHERKHWKVVKVSRTKYVEEVFCAVVPRTHTFAIEGNILTGNCHGCKESGHLSRLLRALGMPGDLAKRMVDEANFTAVSGFMTRVGLYRQYEGPNPYRTQFIIDEDVLDDWRLAPTDLLDAGFKKKTLRHFEVGFDYKHLRITYPIRNIFGELVGVSGRTVINAEPRYKLYRTELHSAAGVPEEYELDKRGLLWHAHLIWPVLYKVPEPVVITEGFKATMWIWQAGIHDVVATIGSYLTDLHANLFSVIQCPVFLFYDNDEAGKIGTWKAIQKLKANELYIAKYPDHREQPDDLDPKEVLDALNRAQSYATWIKENRDVIHEGEEYPSRKSRFRSQG